MLNSPTKMIFILLFSGILFLYTDAKFIYPGKGEANFCYPLDANISSLVEKVLKGEEVTTDIINRYTHKVIPRSLAVCDASESYDFVIMVKSHYTHYNTRYAIRESYGKEELVKKDNIKIKTFFFIGDPKKDEDSEDDATMKVGMESRHFQDVIELNFSDNEDTATNKTMMMLRWAVEDCPNGNYYVIIEDDVYLSVKNLNKFIHNITATNENKTKASCDNSSTELENILFAGNVNHSALSKIQASPEYSLTNLYQWWPPYVTSGIFVMSSKALQLLYVGSLYVQHLIYDDVFLGIVAYKMNITLTHSNKFMIEKVKFTNETYQFAISCKGFTNHRDFVQVLDHKPSSVY